MRSLISTMPNSNGLLLSFVSLRLTFWGPTLFRLHRLFRQLTHRRIETSNGLIKNIKKTPKDRGGVASGIPVIATIFPPAATEQSPRAAQPASAARCIFSWLASRGRERRFIAYMWSAPNCRWILFKNNGFQHDSFVQAVTKETASYFVRLQHMLPTFTTHPPVTAPRTIIERTAGGFVIALQLYRASLRPDLLHSCQQTIVPFCAFTDTCEHLEKRKCLPYLSRHDFIRQFEMYLGFQRRCAYDSWANLF